MAATTETVTGYVVSALTWGIQGGQYVATVEVETAPKTRRFVTISKEEAERILDVFQRGDSPWVTIATLPDD